MGNIFKKLAKGQTSWQVKARDKRFKARKTEIENVLGGAAIQLEYSTLGEMLRAFDAEGAPNVIQKTLIFTYFGDWKRKSKHAGTQSWYALCDLEGNVNAVVWTVTTTGKDGGLLQGGKIYNMETTAVDDLMSELNIV